MNKPRNEQEILSDNSALEPSFSYLRNRSDENLKRLVSRAGSELAYKHHLWSSSDPNMTIEEFWSARLSNTTWSSQFESDVKAAETYLQNQDETEWLEEVLRYLPNGHIFNTTAYLILGYDNIVFGENIALNMNSKQFQVDKREAVYYLIHELAHAGYVRYHPLPELWKLRTMGELLDAVKYLTHLEGMGVISAFRLRVTQGGILDNDYQTLLNDAETERRVNQYFEILGRLEENLDKEPKESDFQVFEEMSKRETRLWYITGCHMAREIEKHYGRETLRELVRHGSKEFFNKYFEIEDKSVKFKSV